MKVSAMANAGFSRSTLVIICLILQESRAIAMKPRDAAAVLVGLKFADNIHYKFKSSQTSKSMFQSSKHRPTGAKQNLTQNSLSRSFKVTWFGVSGKGDQGLSNTYLLRFRRCSVYTKDPQSLRGLRTD